MGFPKYKNNTNDINYILQIAEHLDPFAKEDEKNLSVDPVKSMYEAYNAIIFDLRSLANAEETEEETKKDEIWARVMARLQQYQDRFKDMSVEDINKMIGNHSGLKLWEFSQLAGNLKSQLDFMALRGKVVPPQDNKDEYTELSEKHNRYVELTNNFGAELSGFDSYEAFTNKLEEIRAEEEKCRKEFEFYSQKPNLQYTTQIVEIRVNGSPQQFNYEQAYNLYSSEYEKQKKIEEETQKQIDACFDEMKKKLQSIDQKNAIELSALKDTLKTQKDEMANLTKDVLATIEVGNIESKLSGDLVSIDDYFETLRKEIANRPFIAIRKSTKNEKKYQEKRKDYLQTLILHDQYKEGYLKLTARIQELDNKYAKPYGKTLEEQIARAVRKNKTGELESVLPESIASDEAYKEFQQIKEDFIKLYSVKSGDKNFVRAIRAYESPAQFKSDTLRIINDFEEEYLNPILYNMKVKGRVLTENEIKINQGCELINKNYSQMKATKPLIESCEARIRELNEKKIDPALYSQKQIMDELTLKKYEALGIKPSVDLAALYKKMQDASIAKNLASDSVKEFEPLKNAYLKEKEYLTKFLADKEKAVEAYGKIKGATAKMQTSNEKIIKAWAEYKEVQNKSNFLKERIFNAKDSSEKGNKEVYNSILTNIASDFKHFLAIAKVGRDSIFKDSTEYTKMIDSVKAILAPAKANDDTPSLAVTDPVEVKKKLDAITSATKNYLKAKQKQWRAFPSVQRITRLSYAGNLLASATSKAEKLMQAQAQMTGVQNETAKEYSRAEKELGKENISNINDFFTEIVKPRAKSQEKQNNIAPQVKEPVKDSVNQQGSQVKEEQSPAAGF